MTTAPPRLTDQPAQFLRRARATTSDPGAMFLRKLAFDEIQERLELVNRQFTKPAIVTPFPEIWTKARPDAKIIADTDRLDLVRGAHDLIIHDLCLHWSNDPVGQIIQCARALQPDGMFQATLFGGQTLTELRSALATAESQITGGLSPRVAPMAEIRDLGGLLQRAGLALPVADALTQTVTYATLDRLMHDLRAMGETNVLHARLRRPTPRQVFEKTAELYADNYADAQGRLRATFDIICLSGWAPHPDQPKALRPGSASHSLAAALAELKMPSKD